MIAGVLKKQASDAKKTGADLVVALDDEKEIEGLPTLDAIADTISGPTAAKVVRKLKSGGIFASVLAAPPNASERPDMVVKTMFVKNDAEMLVDHWPDGTPRWNTNPDYHNEPGYEARAQAALKALGRQALHAYLIAIEHPQGGKVLEFRSELPDDFRRLRHSLGDPDPVSYR